MDQSDYFGSGFVELLPLLRLHKLRHFVVKDEETCLSNRVQVIFIEFGKLLLTKN